MTFSRSWSRLNGASSFSSLCLVWSCLIPLETPTRLPDSAQLVTRGGSFFSLTRQRVRQQHISHKSAHLRLVCLTPCAKLIRGPPPQSGSSGDFCAAVAVLVFCFQGLFPAYEHQPLLLIYESKYYFCIHQHFCLVLGSPTHLINHSIRLGVIRIHIHHLHSSLFIKINRMARFQLLSWIRSR